MKLVKTLLAASVAMIAVPTMAYEAGDIMVKAGVITVQPTGNASEVSVVKVGDNTQLGITATYMFHSNWGVELLAATPFEHNAYVSGVGKAVTTNHLPPTVSVQYYPLGDSGSTVQPYVGMGINYTNFYDVEDVAGVGTKDLKDSWGLAYSAGVNVHLNDNWMANVAVWKVDIATEVQGGALNGAPVTIDPTVFLVGVGYKF